MERDLSKVKEVRAVNSQGQDFVNEKLKDGDWILLDVKISEHWTLREKDGRTSEAHLHKDHHITYIIGRIK